MCQQISWKESFSELQLAVMALRVLYHMKNYNLFINILEGELLLSLWVFDTLFSTLTNDGFIVKCWNMAACLVM